MVLKHSSEIGQRVHRRYGNEHARDAHVFPATKMASFESAPCMSRLVAVMNILGRPFMSVTNVLNMAYLFFCGERVTLQEESDERPSTAINDECQIAQEQETSFVQFSAFVDNLSFLYPGIFDNLGPNSFKQFDQFCVGQEFPFSAVFITEREYCRFCGAKLTVCEEHKDVVVYHLTRGTYLGSRFTKKCSRCKTQEHYGHYKKGGKRVFDGECLEKEFLLATEDTAIDMQLMKYLDEEVVQGACPFLLKAKVYNSVHGYGNLTEVEKTNLEDDGIKPKRRRYVVL
jgi:hypothetical protein